MYGDSGYRGIAKREEISSDEHPKTVEFTPIGLFLFALNIFDIWGEFPFCYKKQQIQELEIMQFA